MKSRGNKIKGDNPSWPRVENATTCQVKYCQEYEQCKYFVYNQKTGSCNLKKPDALFFKSPAQGYIFGPRYCTGNNSLTVICTKSTTKNPKIIMKIKIATVSPFSTFILRAKWNKWQPSPNDIAEFNAYSW